MPFHIIHNDITKMNTDAIVNAANSRLQEGGGVCGAIFQGAGAKELQRECNQIGTCPVGHAVITQGYQLPARYIIHAVGPIWRGGNQGEEQLLAMAYRTSLELASKYQLNSISFPLISSGIYGYPKDKALQIAVSVISEFLLQYEMDIYLVVFDRKAISLSEKLFTEINHYIDTYYDDREENDVRRRQQRIDDEFHQIYDSISSNHARLAPKKRQNTERVQNVNNTKKVRNIEKAKNTLADTDMDGMLLEDSLCQSMLESIPRCLDDVINQMEESFSEMLFRLIDEKGITDVAVYKRANIDRKLFSKMRHKEYQPKKSTALALAIALELSLDETKDLLMKAGYSLSNSNRFDLIIQYFIENKRYDMYQINEALFTYDQPLLGA